MDYALAIDILRPNAKWRRSDSYQALVDTWEDVATIPTDQELIDAFNNYQASRKEWVDAEEFFDEFTVAELSAWMNNATVSGFIVRLLCRAGGLNSSMNRVQNGLQLLVNNGVITQARKDEILSNA